MGKWLDWCLAGAVLLLLVLPGLAMAETSGVDAAQGSGTANTVVAGVRPPGLDYATMDTAFSPAHIDPGEPFSFTTSLSVYEAGFYDPHDCTPFSHSATEAYEDLGLWIVQPRSTPWDATAQPGSIVLPTPVWSNLTVTTAPCPNGTFEAHGTARVPGSATAGLTPGCYQSAAPNAGIWFRAAGGGELGPDGTLGTLTVGDEHCARKLRGPPAVDCSKAHVCELQITCPGGGDWGSCDGVDLSANSGSAGGNGGCGGQRVAVRAGSKASLGRGNCGGLVRPALNRKSASPPFTLAQAHVDLQPDESAQVEMQITKRGRRAIAATRRSGRKGPFKGFIEFDGDRSTRQEVRIKVG